MGLGLGDQFVDLAGNEARRVGPPRRQIREVVTGTRQRHVEVVIRIVTFDGLLDFIVLRRGPSAQAARLTR